MTGKLLGQVKFARTFSSLTFFTVVLTFFRPALTSSESPCPQTLTGLTAYWVENTPYFRVNVLNKEPLKKYLAYLKEPLSFMFSLARKYEPTLEGAVRC